MFNANSEETSDNPRLRFTVNGSVDIREYLEKPKALRSFVGMLRG
jgi:hypothetical protein